MRWLKLFGIVVVILLIVGGTKAWQLQKLMAGFASAPEPQVAVSTLTASYADWQPELTAAGSLRAIRGVNLTTEVAGLVQTVAFDSGREVKAGERLVQLNADTDIAKLDSLKVALNLAEINLKRDRNQREADAISQAQLDSTESAIASAKAAYAEQVALVAKKSIRAPFDGRLGITTVNRGQYLNPGDPIVTLQQLDPIHVDFTLPQQALTQLKVGQKVRAKSDSFPDADFTGEIAAINPLVDTDTRNIQVLATLRNPQKRLLPGMFATVNVIAGAPARYLTLPQTAITFNPYGETVFVVVPRGSEKAPDPNTPPDVQRTQALAAIDEKIKAKQSAEGKPEPEAKAAAASSAEIATGKPAEPPPLVARQVFVKVGPTRGDQIAILSGLKEGDVVVTSGQLKLKTGARVEIHNEVVPANAPDPKLVDE